MRFIYIYIYCVSIMAYMDLSFQHAGVWMCEESVGDAGTSSLGYYGGAWGPNGAGLLAHGFTGALHLWRRAGPALDLRQKHSQGAEMMCSLNACWQCTHTVTACRQQVSGPFLRFGDYQTS